MKHVSKEDLPDKIKAGIIFSSHDDESYVSNLNKVLNPNGYYVTQNDKPCIMSEKYIKEFLTKIAKQDNRSTAAPYFYVIRSKVEIAAPQGCGEETIYFESEDPEAKYTSIEEYIKQKKEDSEYNKMDKEDKEEFDEKMERAEFYLDSYDIAYDWKESGMFLTETDAKYHLKSNYYHYSSDAHTYVKHSWRAPELEEFFISLYKHFEIDKGNLDLNIK